MPPRVAAEHDDDGQCRRRDALASGGSWRPQQPLPNLSGTCQLSPCRWVTMWTLRRVAPWRGETAVAVQ